MHAYTNIFIYLLGFIWILFAAKFISKYLERIKLPLITGFLLTGVICGPHVLDLIRGEAVEKLRFINDFSLAYIAFAAGAELYLKELRDRVKSIAWNTTGQLVVTFGLGAVAVYLLSDLVPFMADMPSDVRIGVAILMATIFVARSPSSAIAVINEMRAKGPFTQTAMGVTVVKDVLVIILFTVCFSLASTLIQQLPIDFLAVGILLMEIALSVGIAFLVFHLLRLILILRTTGLAKSLLILLLGYLVFLGAHFVQEHSAAAIGIELYLEPLLICIVASFLTTNFSKYRPEFQFILNKMGPYIYVAFFTYAGSMMSLDVLANVWFVALLFFGVRLLSIIVGAYFGSVMARDKRIYRGFNWMPYVTQAGVGLGLATKVADAYPDWGGEFETIVIALIVLNQFIGPPLFKWSIIKTRESHRKADTSGFSNVRIATLFGLEAQSLALARQLIKHGWVARIATVKSPDEVEEVPDVDFEYIHDFSEKTLKKVGADRSEAIVLMLSDEENLHICRRIYEKFGTKGVIVRLNERAHYQPFHEMGVLIVDPDTAIVSLMDNFVRSPVAASLLLGTEEEQSTMDITLTDKTFHGMALRNLRLPADVIVLSVKRRGQTIISHGYTRLRKRDVVTVVGSEESLAKVQLMFEKD